MGKYEQTLSWQEHTVNLRKVLKSLLGEEPLEQLTKVLLQALTMRKISYIEPKNWPVTKWMKFCYWLLT